MQDAVSTVKPGPKPNKTPQSNPSPVVVFRSSMLLLLISSSMNNTQALDIFPNSLRTVLVVFSFSSFSPSFASTWSRMAGPPG